MSTGELRTVNRIRTFRFTEPSLASRELVRTLAVLGTGVLDVMLLLAASAIATWLRFGEFSSGEGGSFLLLIVPAYFLASLTFQAYALDTLRLEARSVRRANLALVISAAVAFSATFALGVGDRFSRLETGYMLLLSAVFLTLGRVGTSMFLERLRNMIDPTTFVLGDETALVHVGRARRVIDVRSLNWRPTSEDPNFLDAVCRTFRYADRVLLVFEDSIERAEWAAFMRLTGINTELVEPQLKNIVPSGIGRWAGSPTLIISRGPLSLVERVIKRAIDLLLLILVAPAAIPVAALIAVLVRLESPGPALFVQERVGRRNGRYHCYKFRTMHVDALDFDGNHSTDRGDTRITRIGRLLRRTSLDELPQLWNVLVGNMSFVGPRPHALGSTADGHYFWQAVDGYWTRHAMKPGLTGLAQVRGYRGATNSRRDIETRVSSDLEYVNSWSIWLDITILIRTPFVMMHRNAY
jgi:polysaccharide biosynthesis protein PslA